MQHSTRPRPSGSFSFLAFSASAFILAGCAGPQPQHSLSDTRPRSKEYFSEAAYGVKASPRVSMLKSGLRRGGGRDQIGQPYMVHGKMYYPREDKSYKKVGYASWYGDAFHGRLTANGEVYDQTSLTAAHPTMPLPSYARVTNLENGSSVIVRVNDRGPYAAGRIIDLSNRAAKMLDYADNGTAKVQVEYIGRAPLDAQDDQYLLASYRPGNKVMDPSDGLPTGVMVAMNGATPSGSAHPASPFPGVLTDQPATPASAPFMTAAADTATTDSDPAGMVLPAFGPIAPERPASETDMAAQLAVASLSYAESASRADAAFAALEAGSSGGWKNAAGQAGADPYVAAAARTDRADAQRLEAALSAFGTATIETAQVDGRNVYSVTLRPRAGASVDDLLQEAWDHGAPDAIVVRD